MSLSALVRSMVGSAESWDAVVSFCEDVMSQKETAEREREISTPLPWPQKAHRAQEKGGQRPFPAPMNKSRGEGLGEAPAPYSMDPRRRHAWVSARASEVIQG
ncbi:unnamed protein product [Parnassius apollo]|uniref:(apollo) hypothetical protein n=1 Tax=Parnassius apollo TaxID=110799 RepID=A0A8S3W3S5_PARAO|nr:unnamed protein product [Parnassius apollo]